MAFHPNLWIRFEWEKTPIYIRGDKPDWFVPNGAGDRMLRDQNALDSNDPHVMRFLKRLPDEDSEQRCRPAPRHRLLNTRRLKEIWLHLTHCCNLACTHCLFSSSPKTQLELDTDRALLLAEQARDLGCRVFALTGGEPFLHPGFAAIVSRVMAWKGTHVVVLTNGSQISQAMSQLASWDPHRVHLQISVDGLGDTHDRVRGRGQFEALLPQLRLLKDRDWPFTVSMCVAAGNVTEMAQMVEFAANHGATNVHFMWYFIRGRGKATDFVPPLDLLPELRRAHRRAEQLGIGIDNLDSLRSQIFAPSGTRHDGTNAAWESLAVGPDALIYPTPAMIGIPDCATSFRGDLATTWRESPVLASIRRASAVDSASPFRFLLGGGDLDHSFVHARTWMGNDPFTPLMEQLALWMIADVARRYPSIEEPALRLKMGDVLETCGAHGDLAMTHSNCLLSAAQNHARASVMSFYTEAARSAKTDILNPVTYPESMIAHIPQEFRLRGYGCGSPMADADLMPGETVVDLGCGAGVECFIAAPMVGERGRVIGVDMLDPMLNRASRGKHAVAENLGYDNIEFRRGFLEKLPVADESADAVLSNCVLNLSVDKRTTFAEILRILKPGGRLVVSDVVCETSPDASIKNDDTLRGECIAGALTQRDLFGILEESGFDATTAIRRFPYRVVAGHHFFSLTFSAFRPGPIRRVRAMYRGPAAAILTRQGTLLPAGDVVETEWMTKPSADFFVFDENGSITNVDVGEAVCCSAAEESHGCCGSLPETKIDSPTCCSVAPESPAAPLVMPTDSHQKHRVDCMVCGEALVYLPLDENRNCAFCGTTASANAVCRAGHFVCDACHASDALEVLHHLLTQTRETDTIALLKTIRQHPSIPVHGPEHHAMVPGIILATYRNLGGDVDDAALQAAISRGSRIPGGACGFMGACGAAIGVGVGFAVILESNPYRGQARQRSMRVVGAVMRRLAAFEAARCCHRDSALALIEAARESADVLPISLLAEDDLVCGHMAQNKECMFDACPFWPKKKATAARSGN